MSSFWLVINIILIILISLYFANIFKYRNDYLDWVSGFVIVVSSIWIIEYSYKGISNIIENRIHLQSTKSNKFNF